MFESGRPNTESTEVIEPTRRDFLVRAGIFSLAALVSPALHGAEKLALPESPESEEVPEELKREIVESFGPWMLEALSDPKFPERYSDLQVDDFEGQRVVDRIIGNAKERKIVIPGKEVKKMLIDTLPRGWVEGKVSSIKQSEIPLGQSTLAFEVPEESDTPGPGLKVMGRAYYETGVIEFSSISRQYDPAFFITSRNVFHEVAHFNGWFADNGMTPEQRARMLLSVRDRLQGPHTHYPYVERIKHENKKHELFYKVTEYWCEIAADTLRDAANVGFKDTQIVKDAIRQSDPNFDIEAAANKRRMWAEEQKEKRR